MEIFLNLVIFKALAYLSQPRIQSGSGYIHVTRNLRDRILFQSAAEFTLARIVQSVDANCNVDCQIHQFAIAAGRPATFGRGFVLANSGSEFDKSFGVRANDRVDGHFAATSPFFGTAVTNHVGDVSPDCFGNERFPCRIMWIGRIEMFGQFQVQLLFYVVPVLSWESMFAGQAAGAFAHKTAGEFVDFLVNFHLANSKRGGVSRHARRTATPTAGIAAARRKKPVKAI